MLTHWLRTQLPGIDPEGVWGPTDTFLCFLRQVCAKGRLGFSFTQEIFRGLKGYQILHALPGSPQFNTVCVGNVDVNLPLCVPVSLTAGRVIMSWCVCV